MDTPGWDRPDLSGFFKTPYLMPFTIFALPKAFEGHFKTIQTNALESWLALRPKPEIILFGNDPGVHQTAHKYGLRHSPDDCAQPMGNALGQSSFYRRRRFGNPSPSLLCQFGYYCRPKITGSI